MKESDDPTKISYTKEQIAEHERREKKTAKPNMARAEQQSAESPETPAALPEKEKKTGKHG